MVRNLFFMVHLNGICVKKHCIIGTSIDHIYYANFYKAEHALLISSCGDMSIYDDKIISFNSPMLRGTMCTTNTSFE